MSEYNFDDGEGTDGPYPGPFDGQPDDGSEQYDVPPDGHHIDEAFLRPSGESLPAEHPAHLVRAACEAEVRNGLNETFGLVDTDNLEQRGLYEDSLLSVIAHEMAERAVEAGDVETVEAHIGGVVISAEESDEAIVEACMLGARIDSPHASQVLRTVLAAEKSEVELYWEENGPMAPVPHTPLLDRLVSICGKQGMPPDQWIDEFATSPQEHWRYSMDYLHQAAPGALDDVEAAVRQQQLDAKAAELLDGDFPPQFIFDSTWATLKIIKDPALRERFADTLTTMRWDIPLDGRTFQNLVAIGRQIVADPALATSERVASTERIIDRFANTLQGNGAVNDVQLSQMQLQWRGDLAVHNGATPGEVVGTVDTRIGEILNADIPDTIAMNQWTPLPTREGIAIWREAMMNEYAVLYAERGDFTGAKTFINAIGDQEYAMTALMQCLELTTDAEQVDLLSPDPLTLELNPDMNVPFRFAKRRMAGDLRGMATLAVECAQASLRLDEREVVQSWYADRAYAYIAESQHPLAMDAARSVLDDLREAGIAYPALSELSYAVISSGDAEEPQHTYDHIIQSATSPAQRLHGLWRLARHIEKHVA